MSLEKFLQYGAMVYNGFYDLAWAFTEVTLAEMFPELYDYLRIADGSIFGFATAIWNMTMLEFALCTSLTVTLGALAFAIIKWFVDIVL